LRRKDRLLLRTGLGILILSVMTLQYRFEQIHYEYLMACSGIVLLSVSGLAIRYLNNRKLVYSFAPDKSESNNNLLNAEAIILSQTLNSSDAIPTPGIQFGGGTFGGGGAGSKL